jgi:hypothetical protein
MKELTPAEAHTLSKLREESFIQTFSGRKFFPFNPKVDDIDIEDVAHALSNTCRYSGHCKKFYSVAQHSYLVSFKCNPENAMWGLLHDGAECYSGGDIPTPIKHFVPEMQNIEKGILKLLSTKFDLTYPIPQDVHEADKSMFLIEWSNLMTQKETKDEFVIWSPKKAKKMFLQRYYEILKNEAAHKMLEETILEKTN